jgi:predicted ATPase/DNA-binding winged helix-turn-helix (wHTH) protein
VLRTPAPVGGRAFEIMELLVRSAGELVTKDELMEHVWRSTVVHENALQVHIVSLRRALGPYRELLKTVSGRGYRLPGTWTARELDSEGFSASKHPVQLSDEARTNNFAVAVTDLVGRAAVARLLRDLVSAYRVVTLTGPGGGIGKSTLAIELGRGILGDFQGGGWLVELASLADEDFVPSAVASVLGLKLMGGAISAEAVARAIDNANLLLIFDNCEHVIDAAAELAQVVVRFCPHVSVLATSREALRIDGEQVYRVPPLGVPEVGQEDPERVLRCGAVELLMARTRALDSAFSSAADDIPSIAAICRQLDGIPLAIEFAAARAATLGFRRVAASLGDRFRLLTNGRRTALPRHQTLRAAFDWSYELLSPGEQRLLCHLAIFPGAFTFEAAEAVGALEGAGHLIMDRISSLVAKSLVTADEAPCWRLLETTRAYALHKLAESGEYLATARRHAEYVWAIIVPTTTEPILTVDDLIRHGRELDNVRAALDWSFSPDGDVAVGVALVAAFAPVWIHLSLVGECRKRAEQVLGMVGSDLQLTRALEYRLIMALGVALTLTLGPIQQTREVIAKARQLAVGIDDTEVQLRTLWAQWSMELIMGEYGAALGTARQFIELARRQGDDALMLVSDRFLGTSMLRVGELNDARRCLERMVNRYIAPPSGHHTILFHFDQRAMARANLARVLALQGHLDRAKQEAKLSLEEVRDADKVTLCWVLQNGAFPVALMAGDLAAADEAAARLCDLATSLDAVLWKIVGNCCKGKLLIARRKFSEASLAAIEFARTQGAIFWELRAALSAARLRVSQKNRAGAAQILGPVCNRFSEGFDTADMLAAKRLLDG